MPSHRNFALEAARVQDSLLQSYRLLLHIINLALLLIGTLLAISTTFVAVYRDQILLITMLVVGYLVSLLTMTRMSRLIHQRKKDVDYWHRCILKEETKLPPEDRTFTLFKIHQKKPTDVSTELLDTDYFPLTSSKIDELLSKPSGHARQFFESQVPWLYNTLWIGLILLAATSLIR